MKSVRTSYLLSLIGLVLGGNAAATPPIMYGTSGYEAPVEAGPDDLLLLPGANLSSSDVVVYDSLKDTTQQPSPPAEIPRNSTSDRGLADVVSTINIPRSLTVHIPTAVTEGQSYTIWIRNSAGEWSNSAKVNDARPIWVTPDKAYASASIAGLPRIIKI